MTMSASAENLKQQVRDFWNDAPCGSATTNNAGNYSGQKNLTRRPM
jgi:hypothetical protein